MSTGNDKRRACATCANPVAFGGYGTTQWRKGNGKSQCKVCAAAAGHRPAGYRAADLPPLTEQQVHEQAWERYFRGNPADERAAPFLDALAVRRSQGKAVAWRAEPPLIVLPRGQPPPGSNPRLCQGCHRICLRANFSNRQWRKGAGTSRCEECTTPSALIKALLEAGDATAAAVALRDAGAFPPELEAGGIDLLRDALRCFERSAADDEAQAAVGADRARDVALEREQAARATALEQRGAAMSAAQLRDACTAEVAALRCELRGREAALMELHAAAESAATAAAAATASAGTSARAARSARATSEEHTRSSSEAAARACAVDEAVRAIEALLPAAAAELPALVGGAGDAAAAPNDLQLSLSVQCAGTAAVGRLARADAGAALVLVQAGALAQLEAASVRFGPLLEGDAAPDTARAVLLAHGQVGIEAQLAAVGAADTDAVDALIELARAAEAEVSAAATKAAAAAGAAQLRIALGGAVDCALLERRGVARDAARVALVTLAPLLRRRWRALEMAPPAMGEVIAALRRGEQARIYMYEAMLELSAKKQRDEDQRAQLIGQLNSLLQQTHQLEIVVATAELSLKKQRGAAASPKSSMSEQVCGGCEERAATVHCAKCEAVLCDECDAQEHTGKFNRKHQRTPLGGGAGAGGADTAAVALADATAQLRRVNRATDGCKRALSALAHPHFPELSTSALGRLVDCNLLVDREMARDYEIVGDPISAGQGKHTVVKARLLGAAAGAPEFCVLKQVPKSDLRALMNEVLVPHNLDHPLVQRVNCVFVEREGANAYIETPYCPEGDLRQWLRGGPAAAADPLPPHAGGGAGAAPPPLPPGAARDEHEVISVMRLVFTALAYMHGQNVLHRDVKTSNILMFEGKPLLCDFGIAKIISGQTMTATMGSGLTTDFAAPEVLRASNQGTALPNSLSSDMFSAGLVLYEAMYGAMAPPRMQPPFHVAELPPHINPHVVPLLRKLLAPDPADRPSADVVVLEPLFADAGHVTEQIAEQHVRARFFGSLAGTEPYPQLRLGFEVTGVRGVASPELSHKFDACREELKRRGRQGPELAEHWAFAGCPPAALDSICANGLLPVGHPLNPSQSTDEGFFGHPRYGVYLGTCGDYVLKYSKRPIDPLAEGEEVDIIVFKVLPGRVYQCHGVEMGCRPKEGFDCHRSPHLLEWYLPLEGQSCPAFVLTIKAVKLVGDGAGDDA